MKKNRASIVLVVSGLILTVAQSCIAVASGYLADVSEDGLANWVEQNGYLLTIADELFMFGTILLVASALYLFHTFSKRHMLSVAIGLAAWSTAAIGFVAKVANFSCVRSITKIVSLQTIHFPVSSEN